MKIVGQEKPSLEELSHFGVAGMKWGVRKGVGPEIRTARRNVAAQEAAIRAKKSEVRRTTKRGTPERVAGKKEISSMKMAFLKNPDRATAARMTRGEKAAVLLFASSGGLVGLAGASAAIGATSVASRIIAKRQKSGAFDKK